MTDQNLLEFPCRFPIKVMGRASAELEMDIVTIVRRHVPDLGEGAITQRPSREGNYIAFTVTLQARSQQQLDDLYRELNAHAQVVMVL